MIPPMKIAITGGPFHSFEMGETSLSHMDMRVAIERAFDPAGDSLFCSSASANYARKIFPDKNEVYSDSDNYTCRQIVQGRFS